MALNDRFPALPRDLDRLMRFGSGRGRVLHAPRGGPELHLDREMLADPGPGRA